MRIVAIDIETTGFEWTDRVLVVAWAAFDADVTLAELERDRAYLTVPVSTGSSNVGMRDLFHSPDPVPLVCAELAKVIDGADWVIFHNVTFDVPFLVDRGFLSESQLKDRVYDTLSMARATGRHDEGVSLLALAREIGIKDYQWEAAKGDRKRLEQRDPDWVRTYSEKDCEYTLRVAMYQLPLAYDYYTEDWLKEDGNYSLLVSMMRVRGIAVHVPNVTKLMQKADEDFLKACQDIFFPLGIAGPNDYDGITNWLKLRDAVPTKRTKGNKISIDEDSLLEAKEMIVANIAKKRTEWTLAGKVGPEPVDRHLPTIDSLLQARGVLKENSTWYRGLLERMTPDQRVHPNFFVGGTVSSRLSCSDPNVQAFPKDIIWQVLSAGQEGGALVSLDYSQAELRIAAMYAAERNMALLFADEKTDFHVSTALKMWGEEKYLSDIDHWRTVAKRANFGSIYAAGDKRLAETANISVELAHEVRMEHRRLFPGIQSISKMAEDVWKDRGYLTLAWGMRLYASSEDIAKRSYKAFNQQVQGSVAQVVKKSMLEINRRGIPLVNQVHDQNVAEVDPGGNVDEVVAECREAMENAVPPALMQRVTPRIRMKVDCKVIVRR